MAQRALIIDTDPGLDDAIAIALALASTEVDVIGISTVGGNTGLADTTRNALRLLELLGRTDIPVASGHADPYSRPRRATLAQAVHGDDGFANVDLPEPVTPLASTNSSDFLAELIRNSTKPVTLVALGPLTNIAHLCDAHPDVLGLIDRFVIMGGAASGGNVTPSAEFNIWADPEGARRVFASELHTVMVGLDVTNAVDTMETMWGWLEDHGRVGEIFGQMLTKYTDFYASINAGVRLTHQHDAIAVAEAIWPGLLETTDYFVDVECAGELTEGMTVVDIRGRWGNENNASVALGVDPDKFHELLMSSLKRLLESISS